MSLSRSQSNKRTSETSGDRARWTEAEEKTLVDTLVLEVRRGKKAENGFKSTSILLVQEEIRKSHDGKVYELQQIRNKFSTMKKDYDNFTELKSKSGFGWDQETKLVYAPDDVWDRYLKAHPAAKKFRKCTLRNFEEMQELFMGIQATGVNALLPSQLNTTAVNSKSTLEPKLSPHNSPIPIDPDLKNSELPTPAPGPTIPLPTSSETKEQSENTDRKRLAPQVEPNKTPAASSQKSPISVNINDNLNANRPAKRQKRERKTKGSQVADALINVGKIAEKLGVSKTEQAIETLMEEYSNELNEEEMIDAVSIFESLRKSEMFIALGQGDRKIRDCWLRKQIAILHAVSS